MLLALTLVLAAAIAPAASRDLASAASPGGAPRAVLEAVGTRREIPLAELDLADPRTLGAHELRFEGLEVPRPVTFEGLAEARLATGELFVGTVRSAEGESIELLLGAGIAVKADLELLRSLRFPERVRALGAPESARDAGREGDRLWRVQGGGLERIDGAVEGFGARGLRFDAELVGALEVPWAQVAALEIEALGAAPTRAPDGLAPVVVDLADGSRLAGGLARVSPAGLRLVREGGELVVPLEHVLLVSVADGSLRRLSEIAPSSAAPARPFGDELGMEWAPRFDRSVSGAPLTVAGRRYARGIGVHAPSRVSWLLDGSAVTLRGAAGIDDEALPLAARGSAVFRVLVDGKERWSSPPLAAGEEPRSFAFDLRGAREIVLIVDPGADGFAGDRADWLGLALESAQPAAVPPADAR